MPIVVRYVDGSHDIVEGESVRKLDQDTARLGVVELKTIPEGHRIIAFKSNVTRFVEIPQAAWDAQKEAQRAREVEAHKKREAEEEARFKAARTLKGRIRRLVGKGEKP